MAMATIAAVATKPSSIPLLTRKRPKWIFTPLSFCSSSSSSSSSSSASRRKLILYSKPGCCLCDGLKEKLQAAFLLSGPHSLHDVDLQVIPLDFTTLLSLFFSFLRIFYFISINLSDAPFIAVLNGFRNGYALASEANLSFFQETLPRISPRLGVELVHKKIAAALFQ
ncbi:hypothetical protein POTOM_009867 [Populus tomentosa]|uniref:Glutaredoxin-like protein n=1 Tax=Populus tomentosa TaxID=118781 RepID=A0A8X8AC68_POPTO|nr:hypothetical protein POTOM_009867 [Populus tomentosa]